jgi:hypothetical protein
MVSPTLQLTKANENRIVGQCTDRLLLRYRGATTVLVAGVVLGSTGHRAQVGYCIRDSQARFDLFPTLPSGCTTSPARICAPFLTEMIAERVHVWHVGKPETTQHTSSPLLSLRKRVSGLELEKWQVVVIRFRRRG